MIAAIHADAGPGVGLGHVSRCTGLAHALLRQGIVPLMLNAAGESLTPHFTANGLAESRCEGNVSAVLNAAHRVGAKALIADSYRLNRVELRQACGPLKLICFDDNATLPLTADIIVNGSPAAPFLPYDLPAGTQGLLGPAYQVVRRGLTARERTGPVRRLLVTYGGADPKNVGPRLAAILPDAVAVDFVVGPFADIPSNLPSHATVHKAPKDMVELIDRADLAVCAGGQTLFELAAAKLPAISIGIGEDQRPNLEQLSQAGAILFGGWADSLDFPAQLRHSLAKALTDSALRQGLASRAHDMVDGKGADRIALAIKTLLA